MEDTACLKRASLCLRQREQITREKLHTMSRTHKCRLTPHCRYILPVFVGTHAQRNTAYLVNRHSTNTCMQTLVCVQQHRLKTLSLAGRWEYSGHRELRESGSVVKVRGQPDSVSLQSKMALFWMQSGNNQVWWFTHSDRPLIVAQTLFDCSSAHRPIICDSLVCAAQHKGPVTATCWYKVDEGVY